MDCETFARYVDLYLDGELVGEDKVDVEAHLRACEACRDSVRREVRLRAEVRQALLSTRAPSSLKAVVLHRVREESSRGVRYFPALFAVAVVVLVAVASYGYLALNASNPIDEIVEVHKTSSGREVFGTSEQVLDFLRTHAPFPFRLPLAEGDGIRLVGARLTEVGGVPAVVYLYDVRGKRVTVAQYPSSTPTTTLHVDQRAGYVVATFGDNGLAHTVVSDPPWHEVKRFLPASFSAP